MQFAAEANLMILVNADLSGLIQKSGLFSFGKKKEAAQTPGNITGYIQGKSEETQIGDYNFKQQWWMNYPSPATKALWCPKLKLLICGEDSGMMHFLKPCMADTMKCEEAFTIKVHSDRLRALAVDEERRLAYSVGEDRKFKVIDLDKKRVSSEFEISNKKVTCMHADLDGRLAFIGDAEGNMKVVDLAKNPPSCICSVKISGKDAVIGLNLVSKVMYAACAESGKIFVHTVGDVRNSAVVIDNWQNPPTTLKYSFNSYPQVTAIKYWKERGELYVGHASGIVAVFNKYVSIDFPFCSLVSRRCLESSRRPHLFPQ